MLVDAESQNSCLKGGGLSRRAVPFVFVDGIRMVHRTASRSYLVSPMQVQFGVREIWGRRRLLHMLVREEERAIKIVDGCRDLP